MPAERGVTASQLAQDIGVSLNEFSGQVMALLARQQGGPDAAVAADRRREICAAVSAAMISALQGSSLTEQERARLDPMIREVLLPFWNEHCAEDGDAAAYISARSEFYLADRVPGSQVKTAVRIVERLLDSLQLSEEHKVELALTLTPSFAHRMVADVYRLDHVRARYGVQLSLLATLCTLLEMSIGYDSILRILRLG